jgi:DNA polymerase III subunit epsilon
MCSQMAAYGAQLTLDGGDRLHARLIAAGRPLSLNDAAVCLFALRSAPAALVRQLVDDVVRADARFAWRSGTEVALAEWEDGGSLLDMPLERAAYVVFDLETTGTRPGAARIVELGAVRVEGLEPVGRMERLVDPGVPIPAMITALTGIAAADVRGRPRIDRVVDEFVRFAAGAVLVAHNARFDVGFVDAELRRLRGGRLAAPVIDTVALGRRLLGDRLPRMDLGTLAERFDTEVRPCHRALPDAEATAEVLVRLLGLAQERGAATVAEVIGLCAPARRRASGRRGLAAGVPQGPGVYLFRDATERVLYVGKATDLRARVRSYFSGRTLRAPVERAVEAAARVETRPLGSEFEAALLELELIARLRPPANSRGAHPERACYLTLSVDEPVPRLRVTSSAGAPGAVTAGPLRSRRQAEAIAAAVRTAFGLRVCRPRLPADDGSCLAGVIGSCIAPCRGGGHADAYLAATAAARAWLESTPAGGPAGLLAERMRLLSSERRFEEAAAVRDQLDALEGGRRALVRLRGAARRSGVVLAPDVDDRFVQAFACAGGRVVARRRLPRAGDGRLEAAALVAALAHGLRDPPSSLTPAQAEQARIVAAALARPSARLRSVAVEPGSLPEADGRIVRLRRTVPLRG